jgi:hypothetical protein
LLLLLPAGAAAAAEAALAQLSKNTVALVPSYLCIDRGVALPRLEAELQASVQACG